MIPTDLGHVQYTANGVGTDFGFLAPVLDASHLDVYANGVLKTNITDYTVALDLVTGNATVTFNSPPANGVIITLARDIPVTQVYDYRDNDSFPAEAHETALDKLTLILQQHEDAIGRSIKFDVTLSNVSSYNPVLTQAPVDGAVLAWDGVTGNIINGPAVADLATTITEIEGFATTASAAEVAAVAAAAAAAAYAAGFTATSATSNSIGTGTKTFTIPAGKTLDADFVLIVETSNHSNWMYGMATQTGTSLSVAVTDTGGSGTFTDWTINVSGIKGATGATGATGGGGSGSGNVTGPGSSTDNHVALFSGTSGQLLKDSGSVLGSLAALSSVNNANWTGTDLAITNGGTGQSTAANGFDALKQNATTGYFGVVELASDADGVAGTDTAKAMTPHATAAAIAALGTGRVQLATATGNPASPNVDLTWAGTPSKVELVIRNLAYHGSTIAAQKAAIRFLQSSSPISTSGAYSAFTITGSAVTAVALTTAFEIASGNMQSADATGLHATFIFEGFETDIITVRGSVGEDATPGPIFFGSFAKTGPFNGLRVYIEGASRNMSSNMTATAYGYT